MRKPPIDSYKFLKKLREVPFGRVTIVEYLIELPDGNTKRIHVKQTGKLAVIIPLLDSETVVMVRQYRFGVRKLSLEFPMGQVKGKEPMEVGRQELKEETGYHAKNFKLLGELQITPANTSQQVFIYLATGLQSGKQQPEADEFIEVVPVKIDRINSLIKKQVIFDVSTVAAFHLYNTFGKTP
ncbi:hypothetical protein A3G67_00130 [Candidatus Roizmanbacteria bacterium RIFCSPLOWO2_12_FULL_40_12]|uniref:Nudix hydrolase domain-containing protein n=1 Tax=Candidatus Roizmanbacteria bacterium RIFCSPLOWO2_01_FULL_40_42 TaxID=1802066 RepID=A0A1F7J5W6_9BACT|nr:MAG: hypothetical protein A2779_04880 [Candidatus Roizmanbacteria bacterium RIFCSPHIGHO2_01_FULL_40_98]OGK27795.1 MAG: hypothetical protein A3C31_04305 [Candidatus Roizmanbacteria bacterium RIFCSPHIGHO2_02_FULL_40_53]OGK30142.1 MAG: hypothetical protein A2W49_01340 [Candidatus Roizmanbacteria bacterium RIFCSPHIGHO2_12_41_18]OGK50992.1 MAG: hypothetical protein A3B50_03505 [Candidatus Roizmanbacteria bacterium RIFCSPLOWO2_01_FULL_40_42]OGK58540.1 MAG: hypothetical protein A3H84_00070 [Candida